MSLWSWLVSIVSPGAPAPVPTAPDGTLDAFEAGFQFFMGPQYDGHLNDSAPTEGFTTKFGVTSMTYADAFAKGVVTKPWVSVQTPDDVKPIYRSLYYDANRCGEMHPCVGMVVFVDSTLMGDTTPAKNLQTVVGAQVDGVVGDKTLAAVRASDPAETARRLEAADLQHLQSLPNWGVYANGWSAREQNLLNAALALGA